MAEEFITVTWEPDPLVVAKDLAAAGIVFSNTEIPLEASKEPVANAHERAFEKQGPGWKPWTDSYKAQVAARGGQHGILWMTGDLKDAASSPANLALTKNALWWTGAGAPYYWLFHQEGTSKMTSRPFLGMDDQAEVEVGEIFSAFMDAVAETAAGRPTRLRDARGRFISTKGL